MARTRSAIVTAFTDGINAYIRALGGARPLEFRVAGYDPGAVGARRLPGRVAGLLMTRNLTREVTRARNVRRFGVAAVVEVVCRPIRPFPSKFRAASISPTSTHDIVRVYNQVTGPSRSRPSRAATTGWSTAP